MGKLIKVFGPGCIRCNMLYENVKKAAEELGIDISIEKVQDLQQMVLSGVTKTPALWIDGNLVSQGEVLSVEEIKKILQS